MGLFPFWIWNAVIMIIIVAQIVYCIGGWCFSFFTRRLRICFLFLVVLVLLAELNFSPLYCLQRVAADRILQDLQNNPDMWLQVVHILQNTKNLNTKFFALQVSCYMMHWNFVFLFIA